MENEKITAYLLSLIAKEMQLDPASLSQTASFYELGLDSMKLLEISEALEDEFDVVITMTDLFEHSTIEAITNYIANNIDRRANATNA